MSQTLLFFSNFASLKHFKRKLNKLKHTIQYLLLNYTGTVKLIYRK